MKGLIFFDSWGDSWVSMGAHSEGDRDVAFGPEGVAVRLTDAEMSQALGTTVTTPGPTHWSAARGMGRVASGEDGWDYLV